MKLSECGSIMKLMKFLHSLSTINYQQELFFSIVCGAIYGVRMLSPSFPPKPLLPTPCLWRIPITCARPRIYVNQSVMAAALPCLTDQGRTGFYQGSEPARAGILMDGWSVGWSRFIRVERQSPQRAIKTSSGGDSTCQREAADFSMGQKGRRNGMVGA